MSTLLAGRPPIRLRLGVLLWADHRRRIHFRRLLPLCETLQPRRAGRGTLRELRQRSRAIARLPWSQMAELGREQGQASAHTPRSVALIASTSRPVSDPALRIAAQDQAARAAGWPRMLRAQSCRHVMDSGTGPSQVAPTLRTKSRAPLPDGCVGFIRPSRK